MWKECIVLFQLSKVLRIVKILEMQSRGVFRGTDEWTMVSLCLVGMNFHAKMWEVLNHIEGWWCLFTLMLVYSIIQNSVLKNIHDGKYWAHIWMKIYGQPKNVEVWWNSLLQGWPHWLLTQYQLGSSEITYTSNTKWSEQEWTVTMEENEAMNLRGCKWCRQERSWRVEK